MDENNIDLGVKKPLTPDEQFVIVRVVLGDFVKLFEGLSDLTIEEKFFDGSPINPFDSLRSFDFNEKFSTTSAIVNTIKDDDDAPHLCKIAALRAKAYDMEISFSVLVTMIYGYQSPGNIMMLLTYVKLKMLEKGHKYCNLDWFTDVIKLFPSKEALDGLWALQKIDIDGRTANAIDWTGFYLRYCEEFDIPYSN